VAETPESDLADLVRRAQDDAVQADGVLSAGPAWFALTRRVLSAGHDLLVVGTHDPHGLRRLVLGSTARKVMHECPCPVWVSKPGAEAAPRKILIASDLSPLSDAAVCLGLTLGSLGGADTHLLDVVAFPFDPQWSTGVTASSTRLYHERLRADAHKGLQAQVTRSGAPAAGYPLTLHVADSDGLLDHAILEFIQEHHVDLLVLGTAARHGLWGLLLGNTAERLLPDVPCSILAVKPADFRCVVPAAAD
jgi:universal stress protein E